MTYTDHAGELTATKHTMAWQDVRDAFGGAYRGVFNNPIRPGPLAIMLAQSALESGRWKAGLWNFNFSNIKASPAYIEINGHWHQYYRLNELLKQKDGSMKYEWFDPTHPQTRMRAYRTSSAGAAEKVRFLGTASNPAKGNRYQKAWDALEDDDVRAYGHELKLAGYYTAKEAPYVNGLVSLYKEFRAKLDLEPIPVQPPFVSEPLRPEEYDWEGTDGLLHSQFSDLDLAHFWIDGFGENTLGLPQDVFDAIADAKKKDYADDD